MGVIVVELVSRREDCWYKEVCLSDITCNACVKFAEMKHLMDSSNLPKARQKPQILDAPKCDYDAYCRLSEIKSNMPEFVGNGNNLYISSETTGNGKTSWAIKLMLKYFDDIWAGNGFNTRALFISVPTFLIKCKDFENRDPEFENIKKELLSVDLVIWDDIASTNMSSYDYSQLLMYLDSRIAAGLSNIYTGNCTDRDRLCDRLGAKLASRIWTKNTEIIIFKGGDMR